VARGWESKSVEQQQADATTSSRNREAAPSPQEAALRRQRQSLVLSRQRVLQQLEKASNLHHRQMLASALADLDAQLARLG
jgi:hypothetical protein